MSMRDFPAADSAAADPGNGAGLGDFHTINPEDRAPNYTGPIVGAIIVALMLGAGGAYFYASLSASPKPVVTANNLPQTPPPAPVPAQAPPLTADPAAAAQAMAPAAAAKPETTPAPVKSARATPDLGAARARMNAGSGTPSVAPPVQQVTPPTEPTPQANNMSPQANNSVPAAQPEAQQQAQPEPQSVPEAAPDQTAQPAPQP